MKLGPGVGWGGHVLWTPSSQGAPIHPPLPVHVRMHFYACNTREGGVFLEFSRRNKELFWVLLVAWKGPDANPVGCTRSGCIWSGALTGPP